MRAAAERSAAHAIELYRKIRDVPVFEIHEWIASRPRALGWARAQ